MRIILCSLVNLFTFPGAIFKAFICIITCTILKLRIQKINYLPIGINHSLIIHDIPDTFGRTCILVILPFIEMALIALLTFNLGMHLIPDLEELFLWLTFSAIMHSFPSRTISALLWNYICTYFFST